TADCSRAAPSAGARSGPNRAPAKSARSTAARAGSTVGLRASRASRTYGSTPSRPRGQVRGFCARDGTRESASQDECTKTSRLDPQIVRASTALPPNQGSTESPLLRSGEVFQQTARALEVTLLTGLRTGEVIGARWSEIDLERKTWAIPPQRLKDRRIRTEPHRVPSSPQVIAILKALPRLGEFVFPGQKPRKPLNNGAMLNVLRDLNCNES